MPTWQDGSKNKINEAIRNQMNVENLCVSEREREYRIHYGRKKWVVN